jgi:hypothetical protein
MKHVRQGRIEVKNDIGTSLIVKVLQDEGPDDLVCEVIVDPASHKGYIFYFNTEQEFRDWILQLQKTFL